MIYIKKGEKTLALTYNLLGGYMKKTFEIIGFISLICFSFFYTDKIANVIKQNDELLIQIEAIALENKVLPIDAVIEDNAIIPGISGKEIDINKSYDKMKQIGSFNENLLVYKPIKPNISIHSNKDKYIIKGNNRRVVSLVFTVDANDNIDNLLNTLNNKSIKATFFTDGNYFENNNQKIVDLVSQGHNIGNLGYNLDYNKGGVSWMNSVVQKIAKQKDTYCYGKDSLSICSKLESFTIEPTIIIKDKPLMEIKKDLNNGYIISLDVNDNVDKELNLVIDYIKSKGYDIVNLEQLLQE